MVVTDEQLLDRQSALQAEAALLLDELDLAGRLRPAGPPLLVGSYVSGLMCWREIDVMVCVGARAPGEALRLLEPVVEVPGVVGLDFRDERGDRSPTGTVRDERYHAMLTVERQSGPWRVDLTLWLNDPHANLTRWHESVRETMTAEQRLAILRIKDTWLRLPAYPEQVGGTDIYAAVLDHGVRTPEEFGAWLAAGGRDGSPQPESPAA